MKKKKKKRQGPSGANSIVCAVMAGNQKTFHSSRIYIYVYQLRDQETDEMILCRASVSSELTVSFARLNYKTVRFHGRQPDNVSA